MFKKMVWHGVSGSDLFWRKAGLALCALVLGLGVNGRAHAAEPLEVVASFSILGDMVKVIGGEQIRLTTLIGPGADAHAFDPSPADIRTLAKAQVLVVNGLGFESWMPKLARAAGFKGKEVVASEGVTLRQLDTDHAHDHHDHGHRHSKSVKTPQQARNVDPHAWQDLNNGIRYAQNIAEGLSKVDPANAAQYRQRAESYVADMTALHGDIRQAIQGVPVERRRVVMPHDSMGYFGEAYDVTFFSAAGLSSDAEPSAKDIVRLIREVKASASTALFTEGVSGNARVMDQVARETGLKVGGPLFTDSLNAPGQPAGTYLGMFRWNADQIISALKP